MPKKLISQHFEEVKKTKVLLEASVKKYIPFDTGRIYTPDELEYYDSLAFRFEKCVELAIHFFRSIEIYLYSTQSETLRDRLLVMQKLNLTGEIDFWMDARLLRNRIAHTYLPEELHEIYRDIYDSSQEIFRTIDLIDEYLQKKAMETKTEKK